MSVRIARTTKEALERAAADDDRSVASLIDRIVREWLKERGYLPSG